MVSMIVIEKIGILLLSGDHCISGCGYTCFICLGRHIYEGILDKVNL